MTANGTARQAALRQAGVWGGALAALLVAHGVDRWVYLHWGRDDVFNLGRNQIGQVMRTLGVLWIWLPVIGAWMLQSRAEVPRLGWRRAWRTPVLLMMSLAVNGVLAEVIKTVIRRVRPEESVTAAATYAFRPWAVRTFDTGGLALPSSHATIAFAGALMLWRLYPRAWPVWLALGLACGAQRALSGAHFTSDVTAAALVAYLGVACLWRWTQRRGSPWVSMAEAS